MSKFIPLYYGHQALLLAKDDVYNVGMIMMQCGLIDQWSWYPLGLNIRHTTSIKFMPNWIAPWFQPLDLWKKKGKVPPHSKLMPHQSPKDNVALHPIPYDCSRYFTRDVAIKTITLKPGIEFDLNDVMLFYFKEMYENSRHAPTSDYEMEDNSNHICMV